MHPRRQNIPQSVRRDVLFEAGYQYANPNCRLILPLELHHIDHVSKGGPNTVDNLIVLCSNCHKRYHSGNLPEEAIRTWKAMLFSLNNALTKEAINHLLLLSDKNMPSAGSYPEEDETADHPSEAFMRSKLVVTGDGVPHFSGLAVAGLVSIRMKISSSGSGGPPYQSFDVRLTIRGRRVVEAWKAGRHQDLCNALTINTVNSSEE
jgi:hypothetical protein